MFNKNPDVYFQLVGNQPEYAPHIQVTRYALSVPNNKKTVVKLIYMAV